MVPPWDTLMEPRAIIDSLDDMTRPFIDRRKSPAGGRIVLPSLVADEIRSGFDAGGDALGREIGRCFGIDEPSGLSRMGRRNVARIVLRRSISNDVTPVEHTLTLSAHQTEFRTNIPADTPIQIGATNTDELDECVHLIELLRSMEAEEQRKNEQIYVGLASDRPLERCRSAACRRPHAPSCLLSSRGSNRRDACAQRGCQRLDRKRANCGPASGHPDAHAFGGVGGFP